MKFGEVAKKLLNALMSEDFCGNHEYLIKEIESENQIIKKRMEDVREKIGESEVDEEISLNYMLLKNFFSRNLRIIRTYNFTMITKIQDDVLKRKPTFSFEKYLRLFNIFQKLIEDRFSEFRFIEVSEEEPPLDLYVQILTLDDCGVIMDGEELIELKKDKIYFLKKSIINHLINLNVIKIIR